MTLRSPPPASASRMRATTSAGGRRSSGPSTVTRSAASGPPEREWDSSVSTARPSAPTAWGDRPARRAHCSAKPGSDMVTATVGARRCRFSAAASGAACRRSSTSASACSTVVARETCTRPWRRCSSRTRYSRAWGSGVLECAASRSSSTCASPPTPSARRIEAALRRRVIAPPREITSVQSSSGISCSAGRPGITMVRSASTRTSVTGGGAETRRASVRRSSAAITSSSRASTSCPPRTVRAPASIRPTASPSRSAARTSSAITEAGTRGNAQASEACRDSSVALRPGEVRRARSRLPRRVRTPSRRVVSESRGRAVPEASGVPTTAAR